jgi:hypothetical protein
MEMNLTMKFVGKFFLLLLPIVFNLKVLAQPGEDLGKRIYLGGNIGLQFGTNYTLVNVSPLAGYKITERFSAGVGATYIYYRLKYPAYNYELKTHIYGGSLFSRYFLLENIFAHAEYEHLSLEAFSFFDRTVKRVWVPAFFVGGGLQQPIGGSGFAQLLILYDIIQDIYSPYQNPIIRIGFGIAL